MSLPLLFPYFIPEDDVILCTSLANIRMQLEQNVLCLMASQVVSTQYTELLCNVFLRCVAQVQQQCFVHAASIVARNGAMNVREAAAHLVRIWLRHCHNREMVSLQNFADVQTSIAQNIYTLVDWRTGAIVGPNLSGDPHQLLLSLCSNTNQPASCSPLVNPDGGCNVRGLLPPTTTGGNIIASNCAAFDTTNPVSGSNQRGVLLTPQSGSNQITTTTPYTGIHAVHGQLPTMNTASPTNLFQTAAVDRGYPFPTAAVSGPVPNNTNDRTATSNRNQGPPRTIFAISRAASPSSDVTQ